MTIEDLLKPRYKVIADYPNRPQTMPVGHILTLDKFGAGKWWHEYTDLEPIHIDEGSTRFPAILKPLPWWAERKAEEIGYVIVNSETHYVVGKAVWILKDGHGNDVVRLDNCNFDFVLNDYVKPATEEQYNEYINSIK